MNAVSANACKQAFLSGMGFRVASCAILGQMIRSFGRFMQHLNMAIFAFNFVFAYMLFVHQNRIIVLGISLLVPMTIVAFFFGNRAIADNQESQLTPGILSFKVNLTLRQLQRFRDLGGVLAAGHLIQRPDALARVTILVCFQRGNLLVLAFPFVLLFSRLLDIPDNLPAGDAA